ncbi:hypothetical protein [Apilactobacillus xinyiensis]|uniref:hypothetical protein n=1 Tax=Apilactobacillus xinyiensis TaxID=2841032 RepID=UPI001C7DAF1A|nr:hypothetical protein [Apilactobacillus xinyiensis]
MTKFIKYVLMIILLSMATTLINVILDGDVFSLSSFIFGLIFWMIISLIGWTVVFIILYFKVKK